MEKILEVTKSSAGVFSGVYKSKKFALTMIWSCAAFTVPEQVPIWPAAAVVAAYILGQSVVEACAARVAGQADEDAGPKP